jgi:hypothetical protein
MHKTFATIALVDGIASTAIIAGAIFAQVTSVPSVSNGWQLAAFLGLLGLNAYGMYMQNQNSKTTQAKVDEVANKTEVVHKAVNSQLDAFKKEAAEQYKQALEQGISIVKLTAEKAGNERLATLEAKIAALETKLDTEREKAVVLAAGKPIPDGQTHSVPITDLKVSMPMPPQTPEERREEIKGGG